MTTVLNFVSITAKKLKPNPPGFPELSVDNYKPALGSQRQNPEFQGTPWQDPVSKTNSSKKILALQNEKNQIILNLKTTAKSYNKGIFFLLTIFLYTKRKDSSHS